MYESNFYDQTGPSNTLYVGPPWRQKAMFVGTIRDFLLKAEPCIWCVDVGLGGPPGPYVLSHLGDRFHLVGQWGDVNRSYPKGGAWEEKYADVLSRWPR